MQSKLHKKYVKYKNKYLELRQSLNLNQNAGNPVPSDNNLKHVIDELHFWLNQICEHTLFLHLGLEEESFKKRGMEFHTWNRANST